MLQLWKTSNSVDSNGYADDLSVRRTFKSSKLGQKDELGTITIIECSMVNKKSWIDQVQLKMNKSETEFIYFGGSRHLEKCITNTISVNGEDIQWTNITRYLGAYLDSTLSFKEHIKAKCKVAMLYLLKIRAAIKYLTRKACAKLNISLVISHLDYANAILAGLPKVSLDKLQREQNMAAKIELNKGKYDRSSRCLEELHSLPIEQRLNFKNSYINPQVHPWKSS